jgi:hypothetical protein
MQQRTMKRRGGGGPAITETQVAKAFVAAIIIAASAVVAAAAMGMVTELRRVEADEANSLLPPVIPMEDRVPEGSPGGNPIPSK